MSTAYYWGNFNNLVDMVSAFKGQLHYQYILYIVIEGVIYRRRIQYP